MNAINQTLLARASARRREMAVRFGATAVIGGLYLARR